MCRAQRRSGARGPPEEFCRAPKRITWYNCACLPGLPEGKSSAVMLRPLLLPLLSVLVLIGSPGLNLGAAEFTEGNAAAWGAFASDNAAVSVSDDATRVRVGARSI